MIILFLAIILAIIVYVVIREMKYTELENEVLKKLGFLNWNIVSYIDSFVTVKSR